MPEQQTIKLEKKYVAIIRTYALTDSQRMRFDAALEKFAHEQRDIVDKVSLNLNLEGIL